MTQDVLVSIAGAHRGDGDDQQVELIVPGQHFEKNGQHYILFEEIQEDGDERIRSVIKARQGFLSVTRRGAIESQMVFEKGRNDLSSYATPMGEMMLNVTTHDVRMLDCEELLRIEVEYSLDINYEQVSECRITVSVRPR